MCGVRALLFFFVSALKILAPTLLIHLHVIHLDHLFFLTVDQLLFVLFMFHGNFLVHFKPFLVKHFLVNPDRPFVILMLVDKRSCAFHKVFLLMLVALVDAIVHGSLDLQVPLNQVSFVFLHAHVEVLVELLILDLIREVVGVQLLQLSLHHLFVLHLLLIGFCLVLYHSTPFVQLSVLVHRVIPFEFILKALYLLLLLLKRLFDSESPHLQRVYNERHK